MLHWEVSVPNVVLIERHLDIEIMTNLTLHIQSGHRITNSQNLRLRESHIDRHISHRFFRCSGGMNIPEKKSFSSIAENYIVCSDIIILSFLTYKKWLNLLRNLKDTKSFDPETWARHLNFWIFRAFKHSIIDTSKVLLVITSTRNTLKFYTFRKAKYRSEIDMTMWGLDFIAVFHSLSWVQHEKMSMQLKNFGK